MIYIASLYSNGVDTSSELHYNVRQARVEYTMKRVHEFMMNKEFVYSPILHCHEMSLQFNMPKDYTFWQSIDRHMVGKSDKVYVLCMEDEFGSWKDSTGMQDEINFALDNGAEVEYITCNDYS